jgi:ribonuclease P protein component
LVRSKTSSSQKPQGLNKKLRIRRKFEFLRLKKTASKWVARHWVLFHSKNGLDHPRLAVTLSGRYGNAVERNRFRRWLREKFRSHQKELSGLDLHFIAKQKPVNLPEKRYKEELHEDFQQLLHRFH